MSPTLVCKVTAMPPPAAGAVYPLAVELLREAKVAPPPSPPPPPPPPPACVVVAPTVTAAWACALALQACDAARNRRHCRDEKTTNFKHVPQTAPSANSTSEKIVNQSHHPKGNPAPPLRPEARHEGSAQQSQLCPSCTHSLRRRPRTCGARARQPPRRQRGLETVTKAPNCHGRPK